LTVLSERNRRCLYKALYKKLFFPRVQHTYATNLAITGVHTTARAQYLLGHAKAQMTLDGYTHIRGGDMDEIADIVSKMTSSQSGSQKTS